MSSSSSSYRSLSPITGYTGHIPGEKWLIGTSVRRSRSWHHHHHDHHDHHGRVATRTETSGRRSEAEPEEHPEMEEQWYPEEGEDGHPAEVYGDDARPKSAEESTGIDREDAGSKSRSGKTSVNEEKMEEEVEHSDGGRYREAEVNEYSSSMHSSASSSLRGRRANAVPPVDASPWTASANGTGRVRRHRSAIDSFADAQPGWWSEGQALPNLRAHYQRQREEEVAWKPENVRPEADDMMIYEPLPDIIKSPIPMNASSPLSASALGAASTPLQIPSFVPADHFPELDQDIPIIGYSGHLPELHQTSVGRPYGAAARESKRRQRQYKESLMSGGGTMMSRMASSLVDDGTTKVP